MIINPSEISIEPVHTASSIAGRPVRPVAIVIKDPTPEFKNEHALEDAAKFYQTEAEMIAKALYNSLPQGTFDRLIIEVMKCKLSLYRGLTGT